MTAENWDDVGRYIQLPHYMRTREDQENVVAAYIGGREKLLAEVLEALRSSEGEFEACGFNEEVAVWLERKFGCPPNPSVK